MNGNGECVLKLAFPIVEGTGGSKNRYLVQDEHPKVVRVGVIQSNSKSFVFREPFEQVGFSSSAECPGGERKRSLSDQS